MQPTRTLANCGRDFRDRIESAGIYIAGLSADENGSFNAGEDRAQFGHEHTTLIVCRNLDDLLTTESEHLQTCRDGDVRFVVRDHGNPRRAQQPLLLNIPAELCK